MNQDQKKQAIERAAEAIFRVFHFSIPGFKPTAWQTDGDNPEQNQARVYARLAFEQLEAVGPGLKPVEEMSHFECYTELQDEWISEHELNSVDFEAKYSHYSLNQIHDELIKYRTQDKSINKKELFSILRDSLVLDVKTVSNYVGDMAGGDSLYQNSHAISLVLDGEIISSVDIG